jgi:small subunit ribosomal protein S4e
MHLTRHKSLTKFPIARKGTKYIVRALDHSSESVPVLVAVRDILGLAKTAREVKKMIIQKLLKINGRPVRDYKETIKLFNVFEAGELYVLKILPTRKFFFEKDNNKSVRLCKVMGKTILPKGAVQLNLHDGSNLISKEKISMGDSVYLDFSGKMKKHVALEKGSKAFVMSGKYTGQSGTIESMNGKKVMIKLKDKEAELPSFEVIAQ